MLITINNNNKFLRFTCSNKLKYEWRITSARPRAYSLFRQSSRQNNLTKKKQNYESKIIDDLTIAHSL